MFFAMEHQFLIRRKQRANTENNKRCSMIDELELCDFEEIAE
jgi:hypothetical protein